MNEFNIAWHLMIVKLGRENSFQIMFVDCNQQHRPETRAHAEKLQNALRKLETIFVRFR